MLFVPGLKGTVLGRTEEGGQLLLRGPKVKLPEGIFHGYCGAGVDMCALGLRLLNGVL